jgi:SAM-dependent methyltransferase
MDGPAEELGDRDLGGHPDRLRWNERYRAQPPDFAPHPLAAEALAAGPPPGPVLELACGRSGNALALAATGRAVVAVDVSDVALRQLADEARRRGLADRLEVVVADASSYRPAPRRFALVLATRYWDRVAFRAACAAVMPGGLLAWEALAAGDGDGSPWRVPHGELAAGLPPGFQALDERALRDGRHHVTRLLARRKVAGDPH